MDKAIILVFSLIMLLVLSMQAILFSLPFFQRIGFDAVCHRALLAMEQTGGLTSENKQRLEADLKALAFTRIDIHASYNVDYGQEIKLNVHVHLNTSRISPLLTLQTSERIFTFENSVLSRLVRSAAVVP